MHCIDSGRFVHPKLGEATRKLSQCLTALYINIRLDQKWGYKYKNSDPHTCKCNGSLQLI